MAKARIIEGLQCAEHAATGARLVLLTRFAEMCDERARALEGSDIEGVHDMRVASRRLRSALRDFRTVFPKRALASLLVEIKIIADSLGAVRDRDVAIAALQKLAEHAATDVRDGVNIFTQEHTLERDHARLKLSATIAEENLSRLEQEFATTLDKATASVFNADGGKADGNKTSSDGKASDDKISRKSAPTFRQVGRKILKNQFAQFRKHAACIYRPAAIEELHELRIEAKRLRYALEVFAACWGQQLDDFAAQIAEMQSALGELHDCDEWVRTFGNHLTHQHHDGNGTHDADEQLTVSDHQAARDAAAWLLGHFAKERTRYYRDALALWHEWETTGFARKFHLTLDGD